MDHGNNRVILASDGDFNVGVSSDGELERLIERKRTEGTYLTILGFGTGNYQDAKMENWPSVATATTATSMTSQKPARCWYVRWARRCSPWRTM